MRRIFEQKTLSAPRFRLRISQSGNGIGDVEGEVGHIEDGEPNACRTAMTHDVCEFLLETLLFG
jgi:hypothetical protein